MFAITYLLGRFIADLFKSRRRLELENLFLRHQLNIILRRPPQRVRLRGSDRVLIVWMMRRWPSLLALASSCAAGHHPAGGTGQGSAPTGAGNPEVHQEGPESSVSCAISSDK
jgi:hypothetical protein